MPASLPHIIFTVTNDLTCDQRMIRICSTLAEAGYRITLIGIQGKQSLPLPPVNFDQIRMPLRFLRGKAFYLEYQIRLYRLLKKLARPSVNPVNPVAICGIDLDTLLPCYLISLKYDIPRVYDAHELFTELTEVKKRPWISFAWILLEKWLVPRFRKGYTVNGFISQAFRSRYGVQYEVIRNMPFRRNPLPGMEKELADLRLPARFFLYQGAVNEGRAFEYLIPAMQCISIPLVIAGDGNFMEQLKQLITMNRVSDKVILTGKLPPALLHRVTPLAFAGITLFENTGLNQYYSLANRFFDYVQAGIPQIVCAYPEYNHLLDQFEVGVPVHDITAPAIAEAMNKLLDDDVLYQKLQHHCVSAAREWCWENEADRLRLFWKAVFLHPGGH